MGVSSSLCWFYLFDLERTYTLLLFTQAKLRHPRSGAKPEEGGEVRSGAKPEEGGEDGPASPIHLLRKMKTR
jgi:hypothetical protein